MVENVKKGDTCLRCGKGKYAYASWQDERDDILTCNNPKGEYIFSPSLNKSFWDPECIHTVYRKHQTLDKSE